MGNERIMDEEAVFIAALAIDEADERSAYLQRACGGDTALLARMEALLRVHASENSFIEQAARLPATDDRRPRDVTKAPAP